MRTGRRRPWRGDRIVRGRAQQLRRDMTPPERILWTALRSRQIDGFRFRRQHPIGDFIVDFCCPEARLIIELDGETHEHQHDYDEMRTRWLAEQRDYDVFRVSNEDVVQNLDGVYEAVAARLRAGPTAVVVRRSYAQRSPTK